MNKITKTILSLLILCLILGTAFYPKLKPLLSDKKAEGKNGEKGKEEKGKGGKEEKSKGEKDKGGKGGPAPVEIMVISTENLDEKILTTGTLIPNEEVEIRSEISGRITQINFKEGDNATQGQVLVKINDADLQAQLQKLNYQKQLATVNENRQQQLLKKEAISQSEYDISLTSLNSIGADIENLKAQLAKTVIKAPFSGKIGLRFVSLGSYISPTTKITSLTSRVPIKIDFSVPAKYASTVSKGTNLRFTVEGDERKYNGKVYAVESKIDPTTRSLILRAISPNETGKLTPGAFARIEIVLGSNAHSILVPTESIVPDLKGQKVFVLKNNKVESVKVEVGNRTSESVEILSGLSAGDTLITSGVLQVKVGGEVEIKNK